MADVERVADGSATGNRADQLPDLVVRWSDRPATPLDGVRSTRYGTVHRHGVGSGRSGNHTEGDAWALVVPGAPPGWPRSACPASRDIAAILLALGGGDPSVTVGEPLLER